MLYEQIAGEDTPDLAAQVEALRHDCSPEVNDRFDALIHGLQDESRDNHDPYLQGFCGTLLDKLNSSLFYNETLLMYLAENPTDNVPVGIRKLFSSAQELVLPIPRMPDAEPVREKPLLDENYPVGYDSRGGKWRVVMDAVEEDLLLSFPFRLNLMTKPLQSNVLSRFAVQMVVPQLFGHTRPNVYSGGSSFGLVEEMAIYYAKDGVGLPNYRVGVLGGNNPSRPKFHHRFAAAKRSTREFLNLLNNPDFRLNQVLGVDKDPPSDPLTRSYAYSNCFRAPEFRDTWYRDTVSDLLLKQPPNMRIINGDFTDPAHVDKLRAKVPEWFRLPYRWANFSFSRYGLTDEQQEVTETNARQIAGRKGHRLDLDFTERESDGKLRFHNEWCSWTCNLFVTRSGDESPLHVLRLRNGRALDITAGDDLPTDKNGLPVFEFGIMQDVAT